MFTRVAKSDIQVFTLRNVTQLLLHYYLEHIGGDGFVFRRFQVIRASFKRQLYIPVLVRLRTNKPIAIRACNCGHFRVFDRFPVGSIGDIDSKLRVFFRRQRAFEFQWYWHY
jgi:hypothetical protein